MVCNIQSREIYRSIYDQLITIVKSREFNLIYDCKKIGRYYYMKIYIGKHRYIHIKILKINYERMKIIKYRNNMKKKDILKSFY